MAREYRISLKESRKVEAAAKKTRRKINVDLNQECLSPPKHDCWDNATYVETDGALGQAYYCSVCGGLLQVG